MCTHSLDWVIAAPIIFVQGWQSCADKAYETEKPYELFWCMRFCIAFLKMIVLFFLPSCIGQEKPPKRAQNPTLHIIGRLICKALLSFLRTDMLATELRRQLRARGFNALADILGSVSLPIFAAWRWGDLGETCIELNRFIVSLAAVFDTTSFNNQRDTTRLRLVTEALTHPDFIGYFAVVLRLCIWICKCMAWIGGCPCHSPDDPDAKDCPNRGRRLFHAHDFVTRQMQWGVNECNSWTPGTWQRSLVDTLALQACVRSSVVLATEKTIFLEKVQTLLCRLGEPGARQECIDQWESAPNFRFGGKSIGFPLRVAWSPSLLQRSRPPGRSRWMTVLANLPTP